ncbi:MAG: PAS domain-containing protein [Alphaproteobacteria bacterium]
MSTVLVVDDRVTNRAVLSRLAAAADAEAEVHAFADPREAIAWAAEHTPDLVVTDFKMPHMDGAEFTRNFRNQPLCFDVPVIVVTIYEDKSFRYRALEAGATDFLISPLDHQEFQARVRNFLRMRRQQKIIQRRTRSLERRLASDNREHEAALRETREMLRHVIDTVPAVVQATDTQGRLLLANAALAELRGLPGTEVLGRPRAEIYDSADADRYAALDRRLFEGRDSQFTYEEELTDGHGARRTFLTFKSPLRAAEGTPAAVVTVSLEITDRKRIERQVERQNSHLRVIVDNIPSLVYATDEAHRFTLANRAFGRLCGASPDELIGRTLGDFAVDRSAIAEDRQASLEVLRTGRAVHRSDVATTDAFGQTVWLQTVKVPIVGASGDMEVLTVATDISERRRAEEVLREARDTAEEASRSKSAFLASMSHELRTPLNHIMGFSEMMAREMLGPVGHPRYVEYSEAIHDSGRHLLGILDDILDVSRFESGRVELVERPVDCSRILASVVRNVGDRVRTAGLELVVDEQKVPPVLADERMLRQMLLNLLSNATKFTPAGGKIRLGLRALPGGGIEFSVVDTGVGISPENIPRALAPFGQIDNVLSRNHHGAGLGLSLVKSMIERHGGALDIESALGEGTRVAVRLPPERTLQLERGLSLGEPSRA